MGNAALYTLVVCTARPSRATRPGREPSLTRQDYLEHSMLIRAGNHSKRVICRKPDPTGGYIPDDVIDIDDRRVRAIDTHA